MTGEVPTTPPAAELGSTSKVPSRWMALLLALAGPFGAGQTYLGQTRRGALWLTLFLFASGAACLALHPLGGLLGYGFAVAVIAAIPIAEVAQRRRTPVARGVLRPSASG